MKITLKKFLKIFFVIFLIWVCIIFLMMSKKIVEGKTLPTTIYPSKAEADAATTDAAANLAERKAALQTDLTAYKTGNKRAAQKRANEEQAQQQIARASNVSISNDAINDRFKALFNGFNS
jgi:hypothetical protein